MRTVLAAATAALLAAAITATAANQGEPVKDAAAVKQLKKLNRNVSDLERETKAIHSLVGPSNPYDKKTVRGSLQDIERNTHATCEAVSQYSWDCP